MHETDIPGWMTPNDLRILYQLSKYVSVNGSILEIGCFLGRSTSALYKGKHSSVSLEVVDPFEDICTWSDFNEIPNFTTSNCIGNEKLYNVAMYIAKTKNWLEAFRFCIRDSMYNNIDVYKGTSQTHPLEKNYDLVFIDGAHSYEGVSYDIIKYSSLNTLIVGDDFNSLHPGVSKAINELREHRTLIVFSSSKLWVLVPMIGYWKNVFKNNNLIFL